MNFQFYFNSACSIVSGFLLFAILKCGKHTCTFKRIDNGIECQGHISWKELISIPVAGVLCVHFGHQAYLNF